MLFYERLSRERVAREDDTMATPAATPAPTLEAPPGGVVVSGAGAEEGEEMRSVKVELTKDLADVSFFFSRGSSRRSLWETTECGHRQGWG